MSAVYCMDSRTVTKIDVKFNKRGEILHESSPEAAVEKGIEYTVVRVYGPIIITCTLVYVIKGGKMIRYKPAECGLFEANGMRWETCADDFDKNNNITFEVEEEEDGGSVGEYTWEGKTNTVIEQRFARRD